MSVIANSLRVEAEPAIPVNVRPGVSSAAAAIIHGDTTALAWSAPRVEQLQCFLVYKYDYDNLKIDGAFGSETEAAVKAVQRCSGIKVDGQVGLRPGSTSNTPRPDMDAAMERDGATAGQGSAASRAVRW
ncbi:peptidoglycan-binding protein [Streptomyces sp. NPDC057426]|uniref:peptidoglycan-binding domain-containing protein n=1 Tax=Streptomyces sp. NPDC057426 TaxID=3346128 RepID=UPI00369497A2